MAHFEYNIGEAQAGITRLRVLGRVAAIVACVGLILFGGRVVADRADANAARRASAWIASQIERSRAQMVHELANAAEWYAFVARTEASTDHGDFRNHVQSTLRKSSNYDFVLTIDLDARHADRGLPAGLTGIVENLEAAWERRAEPTAASAITVSDFVEINGRPALVAGIVIPSRSAIAVALIGAKPVDEAFLNAMGRSSVVQGLALARGTPTPGALNAFALPMSDGNAFHLQWWSDEFGRGPGANLLPWVVGAFLLFVVFVGVIATLSANSYIRLAESERRTHALAYRDTLTGRANRACFLNELRRALAARGSEHIAVVYIDLDAFKEVNDTLGHTAGDELLRLVADRLAGAVRGKNDVVARFGGDEFAVMIAGLAAPDNVPAICQRLAAVFDAPFVLGDQRVSVGAAFGAAVAPDHGQEPADLMRRADIALHRAKKQPRGTWIVFEPAHEHALVHRRMVNQDLRVAIETDQLVLHYQPEFANDGERMLGFEALVRWNHPERGIIPPSEFIAMAEETALIVQLDEWVLRRALQTAKAWDDCYVAVNLSPLHFRTPGTVDRVRHLLAETGFDPRRLELEITENVLLSNVGDVCAILGALRGDGVRFVLDDFGTGYSSLGYVRRFMFDKLKIDKSFVQNLGVSEDAPAIVECVTRLGRSLGITVLAEGVETREQHRFLQACGCHQLQGFLFGRPMPEEAANEMARGRLAPKRAPHINLVR